MKNKFLILLIMLIVSINAYATDYKEYRNKSYLAKYSKKSCNTYGGHEMDNKSAGENTHHKKKKEHYKNQYKHNKTKGRHN